MALKTYTPAADKIVHTTSVDFNIRPSIFKPVHLVQYDNQLPIIAVSLYNNGQPYAVPEGLDANIRLGKKDRKFVSNPALGCSTDRRTLYFEVTTQMVMEEGKTFPIVELIITDKVAGSSPICVLVERNPVQIGDIESSNEAKSLFRYVEDAKDAAESASGSATNAAASASAAATSAANAKKSEDAAATSAAAAKASQTDAANSASNAATSEGNAAASAAAAKASQTAAKTSEDAAKASQTAAASSASAAATSATNSKNSADAAKASETAAATSEENAASSAKAASDSEKNAKASEDAAKASQTAAASSASAAATSATNSKNSADAAKASETAAATSEENAATSAAAAKASETAASTSATSAAASAKAAEGSQNAAAASQSAAKTSETAAHDSAVAAKASETNAKDSATNATASATAAAASATKAASEADRAKEYADGLNLDWDRIEEARASAETSAQEASDSADAAKASEDAAKASEMAAASSASAAARSASNASTSATAAAGSASSASTSADAAKASQTAAASSASAAAASAKAVEDYANTSKSYAVGETGTRVNEDSDNAKYYYEQAKRISQGLQGSLLPMGTVTFSQLAGASKQAGYMYNISDAFTTDSTFNEGAGHPYPAGTNVYYTAEGKWDCLAGTDVVSVNGRIGAVTLTKSDVGLGQVDNTADSVKNVATARAADTAAKLTNSRNIDITGDVIGSTTFDGSTNASIFTIRRGCMVGQYSNTAGTATWYKFASITISYSASDSDITFFVKSSYGDATTVYGILTAHIRTGPTGGAFSSAELKWLFSSGIDPNKFCMMYSTQSPYVYELWVNVTQEYRAYRFDVISEGSRTARTNLWTLYNEHEDAGVTAPTTGYTKITSSLNSIQNNTDTATKLATKCNINGVGFDGTQDITVRADPTMHTATNTTAVDALNPATGFYNIEGVDMKMGDGIYHRIIALGDYSATKYATEIAFPYENGVNANPQIRTSKSTTWSTWRKLAFADDKAATAGTADRVAHSLTFSGGVTGSWNGTEDKTIPIPTTLPANGGTAASCTGNAGTASKLLTARSLKTNLASTAAVTFDGSGNQDNIPVTGILGIANGGTGNNAGTAQNIFVPRRGYAEEGDFDNLLGGINTMSVVEIPNDASHESANAPAYTASYNVFTTQGANPNYATQLAISMTNAPAIFLRSLRGTTWSAWARVYDDLTYKPSAADVGAVSKTGDTMMGRLILGGTSQVIGYNSGLRNANPIQFFAGDAYGSGIVIGDGGRTIIGGGESATVIRSVLTSTDSSEELHLASDANIYFHTNVQTLANRHTITMWHDGRISGVSNPTETTDAANKTYVDTAVAAKQNKLTGKAGQVVGFDASGNAVAQAAPPSTDNTKLPLTGGTLTGPLIISSHSINSSGIRFVDRSDNPVDIYIDDTGSLHIENSTGDTIIEDGVVVGGISIFDGTVTYNAEVSFNRPPTCSVYPENDNELVTKLYVDNAIRKAILDSWDGAY